MAPAPPRKAKLLAERQARRGSMDVAALSDVDMYELSQHGLFEPVPALIIIVPVLSPMIRHLGFDPTHIGIIVIMMLVVGSVTPPVGILAMVACKIAGVEYNKTFGMLMPYTGAWMIVVLLVAYNPWLVTWLPSLMNN